VGLRQGRAAEEEEQRQAQLTAEADGMAQRGWKIKNNGIEGMTIFSMAHKGLV
jgi:hypothetical protein